MPDIAAQLSQEPPINKAVDDVLAIACGNKAAEEILLGAMLSLCCERLAALVGRARCLDRLAGLDRAMREARPARLWPD